MAHVTPGQAAELTGKHRSTIIRAIEKGSLSAARDEGGHYLIDPAELERAFGTLRVPDARDDAERHPATDLHVAALTREVELLRDMLAEVRATNERDRRAWEDERTFMRSLVERRDEQVKLLTDQREQAPRAGFWQRLLRRA
jgi:excisionase family DNA binding protein